AAPAPRAGGPRRSDRRNRGASLELSFKQVCEVAQAGARARLDGTERDVQVAGYLALRQAAVVRELDHLALVRPQALERAMDAPRRVRRLGALRRRRLVGR